LDTSSNPYFLVLGANIASPFANAFTSFLESSNVTVAVSVAATNQCSFLVAPGLPPFNVNFFRDPTGPSVFSYSIHSGGVQMTQGDSDATVGLAGFNLPTSGVTLGLSGDGIDVGATAVDTSTYPGVTILTIPINIHPDAVAGLRTFSVSSGGYTLYANGYLRIRDEAPDYNFDGLDDRFQRQYFPLWTSPSAAPGADPDNDGFNNQQEYIAGTDPTNAASVLKIDSVTETVTGTLLSWEGQPGKTYQVLSKAAANQTGWTPVGSPFVSSPDESAQAVASAGGKLGGTTFPSQTVRDGALEVYYLDTASATGPKFYRIQALP
jgi:hypothetical protein